MTHYTRQLLQGNAADCSATCVRIISEFFGQHVSYVEMRALCGVGREGANVSQIKRGAEKLGFQCLIKKKGVVALSRQETPSILHWDARHFVVLDRVRNGTFYINDPAVGRRKLTKEEFQKHYTGICVEITPGREMRTARTPLSLHVILDLLDTQTRRLYSIFGLAVLTGGMFATNSATMNMDFMSTIDDELVVNYHKKIKGTLGSDSQDLINILMRKVSRRIPYTK